MKITALLALSLISLCAIAKTPPNCNIGFGPLPTFIINTVHSNHPFAYRLQADNKLPQGYSWGGLYARGLFSHSAVLYCIDADQFIDVIDRHNSDNYCIIDSGTELGDNHLLVYQQHGDMHCHITIGTSQNIQVRYQHAWHSAKRFNDTLVIARTSLD
ncbi:MAG: hypothetical protein COV52_08055 [Gammaproteobacteria bacterium CG11_big_fil_rev_8_21_14_0_20_46_22]|nr:MAG: hypothetical protein COW05_05070 [Gammaproteobacteria bacterium CG12_big_fil_rev_8_21_14_0_65_46_12]PIR10707.1 MAG: hypothetical protein COV52_08055 [Gammaproteobacteria bacterium CG11_big_fil_rev_8_21_14_0_20_46_22]